MKTKAPCNGKRTLISSVGLLLLLVHVSPALADKASATNAVTAAQAMVRSAEQTGADSMATAELKMARDLLYSAQTSLNARDWQDAEYAAKKSRLDAEVADAKTEALKAENALAQLQSVVDTLRSELKRQGEIQ